MAYIKSAHEDQDHFTCDRGLAFRKHFQRSPSQSTEPTPPVTGGAGKDEKSGTLRNWDQLQEALKKRGEKLTDDDLLRIGRS
jgi:hypothetical protein